MEKIIDKLIKIASEIDGAGLHDIATELDKIASKSLQIKIAQYVGIQGYWIRNSRCWSNCYRQKRTDNPNMPTQKVWSECQSEYVDAIKGGEADTKWARYAEAIPEKIRKIASIQDDFAKRLLISERSFFHKKVAERINSGWDVKSSIEQTINDGVLRYSMTLSDEAEKLLSIAEKLRTDGKNDMSQRVAEAAGGIYKEAQFGWLGGGLGRAWGDIKGLVGQGNKDQKLSGEISYLKSLQTAAVDALQKGVGYKTTRQHQFLLDYYKSVQRLQKRIIQNSATMEEMFGQNPQVSNLLQTMKSISSLDPGKVPLRDIQTLVNDTQSYISSQLSQSQGAQEQNIPPVQETETAPGAETVTPPPLPGAAEQSPATEQTEQPASMQQVMSKLEELKNQVDNNRKRGMITTVMNWLEQQQQQPQQEPQQPKSPYYTGYTPRAANVVYNHKVKIAKGNKNIKEKEKVH